MRQRAIVGTAVVALLLTTTIGATAAPQHRATTASGRFGVPVEDPAFADLALLMAEIGGTDDNVAQLASVAVAPLPESVEFINPFTGAPQESQPDYLNPLLTVTSELSIPNISELAAAGGPLAAGPGPLGEVFYGQGLTQPAGESWYLYAKVFTEPCVPSGVREYGVVGLDTTPLNGGNPERYVAAGTTNLFYGANFAYVLHSDPQNPAYTAQRYEYGAPGAQQNFNLTNSNWMGICLGNTVIGLIPEDEWDGTTDIRLFSYGVPFQNGQAQTSAAAQMRDPGVNLDPQLVDGLGLIEVGGPQATQAPSAGPTTEPTAEATTSPTQQPSVEATAQSTAPPATAAAATPVPTASGSASAIPATPAPAVGPTASTGNGFDPLLLLALAGIGLIALALALFFLVGRRDDCDELAKLAAAAQDACDRSRKAAQEARARNAEAEERVRSVEAYQARAKTNLAEAEAALKRAEARAGGPKSESYVEGEPHGRITGDDLALQNEANAAARAEADAAKAAARDAWKDAGSHQGNAAAALDDQLSAIEKQAQAKMAHNNDPRNLDELRKGAGDRAAADVAGLKSDVEAARRSIDEAAGSLKRVSETEATTRAQQQAAEAEADRVCREAAEAQKVYDDCVKAKNGEAAPKPVTPPPGGTSGTTTGPGTGAKAVGVAATTRTVTRPKSKAPDRPCKDGEEAWQPEGEARVFEVRADGAKTRVRLWTEPGVKAMEQWIKDSASGSSRPPGEDHASITSAEIDLISATLLSKWFGPLAKAKQAPNIDIFCEVDAKSVSVQCQRKWKCEGGQWVETDERRSDVKDAGVSVRTLSDANVTPSSNVMRRSLNKAKKVIDELKKNEAAAEKAARCE